jgi:hypothetical protein
MLKKVLCSVALLATLSLLFAELASAQNTPTAQMTSKQPGLGQGRKVRPPFPPCPPGALSCLFYGGDGDALAANANGLWDNNSSDFGIDGAVYSPFTVPAKTGKCGGACDWGISGLFAAIEYFPSPPTVASVNWAILQGVVAGGTPATATTVCSGIDSSPTLIDTGRLYFGFYEEFWTIAHVAGCPALDASKGGGEFWEVVQPNTGGGIFQLAYESNVPDSPAPNAFGSPEPSAQSFFLAPGFGFSTFVNANNAGAGAVFNLFSAGVEGALVK